MEDAGITLKKELLIDVAKEKYGEIFPCSGRESFDGCFTEARGVLSFWFNTADDNSHLISDETNIKKYLNKEA